MYLRPECYGDKEQFCWKSGKNLLGQKIIICFSGIFQKMMRAGGFLFFDYFFLIKRGIRVNSGNFFYFKHAHQPINKQNSGTMLISSLSYNALV